MFRLPADRHVRRRLVAVGLLLAEAWFAGVASRADWPRIADHVQDWARTDGLRVSPFAPFLATETIDCVAEVGCPAETMPCVDRRAAVSLLRPRAPRRPIVLRPRPPRPES